MLVCIFSSQATCRQPPAGTSKLWDASNPEWVRTWAKKQSAMPFLHNFSFQCHTLEQSILQITKLKVERFTNCQQVRGSQPCHDFTDSFSTHENQLCMVFMYICVSGHFPNAFWRTLNRKLMPQGKYSFFPSSLTKTSTDLLWLDWLPAGCCSLFDFTLGGEKKITFSVSI